MLSNHTQDWIPRREGSAAGIDLSPAHRAPTILDVEAACALAEEDFDSYRSLAPEMRAMFLDAIADAILELGPHLVSLAALETGLSRARLEGERARIVSQLRMYAGVLRDGHCFTIEPTAAAAQLEMRMRKIALGPVAVFCSGDSFSVFAVAGADTASALAAGCPVIVHACSAQARTAGLLGGAIRNAMRACGIAQGVFSMLQGDGRRLGQFLAVQPAIKAIAFTGQRRHVQTLMQTIATRAEPIPLYAEVNSVNPVFLLPGALGEAAVSLARCFADSLIQGTGQFCPTPGLLLALEGPALQRFADAAAAYIAGKPASMVLSPAALKRYNESIQHLSAVKGVGILVKGMPAMPGISAQPALLSCDAATYMANPELQDEMVGPSALLVRCRDARELCQLAAQLSG